MFVSADKTRNMYGLDSKEYDKLLNNNVTKSYKKSNIKTVNEINKEANVLTEKLNMNYRVQCITKNEAFIAIKDHKPNFPKNAACRLLNPGKSEIDKVSKVYLNNINKSIEINLKITDFFDISLDLENDKSTNTENLKTHLYTYTVNLIFL